LVAWVLALVVGALTLATVATWRLLVADTDARIETELHTEIQEFVGLTRSGRDPGTGALFDSLDQVLRSAISYDVAKPDETFLAYLDGAYRYQSRAPARISLGDDPGFTSAVAGIRVAASGRYESAAGEVRYLAIPVTLREHPGHGVIVAAYFIDQERAAAENAARLMAGAGAVTGLLAAAAAWALAGRILRPVRDVALTAQAITETDLSARIPVVPRPGRRDEVGELVEAVNAMLDRIEEGSLAQRRFVDDAGHELRTPITIMRGHLDVVDTADPDDVRSTLELVDDELGRMNRIVSDLLVLAKAGQPQFVRPEPTDVAALLNETVAKARWLADRDWSVSGFEAGADPDLHADLDAQRLIQALLVLADNAARHTSEGDQIVFGAETSADPQEPVLRLWVADTGTGVAEHDRDRIFERFARGSDNRRSDGAGLGLTIAAAIAAAHDGRLELSAGVGAGPPRHTGPGATFTLILPHLRRDSRVTHRPRVTLARKPHGPEPLDPPPSPESEPTPTPLPR
jgi:signal transduction histidine kinase